MQKIAHQLLQAISQLHSLKLTHTDLKPENILFTNSHYNKIYIKTYQQQPIKRSRKKSRELTRHNYHNHSDSHTTVSRNRSFSRSRSFERRHFNKSIIVQTEKIIIPRHEQIKVIDFGGATFDNEHHTSVINTRQYRAPEVILQCCRWDQKSDMWSIACIIIELYSGILYFNTHNNYEHLALIQKQFGSFPAWMIKNAPSKTQESFLFTSNSDASKQGIYLNWPTKLTSHGNIRKVIEMKTYKQIIAQEHKELIDLLDGMFQVDPKKRISCKEALQHQFFKKKYQNKY